MELGYHFGVETGPTSNFVGNHMTQGAIDLVQAELGQISSKVLLLRATQKGPKLGLPAITSSQTKSDRTPAPILIENHQKDQIASESVQVADIGPIIVVPGQRPPDLSELRKTIRRQRSR